MIEKLFNIKSQKEKRKYLRNNATNAEKKLWVFLRNSQLNENKFRRQHGIGPYIVDFYCPELKLVIEVDGEIHNTKEAKEYDDKRTKYFQLYQISVLRFRNNEIFNDVESVLQAILVKAKEIISTTP
ncbi:MAG: endonuclease domain-containing protein [Bacteroidota bacterium]